MYRNNRYLRCMSSDTVQPEQTQILPDEQTRCDVPVMTYAMAYVKNQKYGGLFDEGTAFSKGTLFEPLYFPYEGGAK